MISRILVHPGDPQVVYAAAWSTADSGGGVFQSTDGGFSWRSLPALDGQSVRSLAWTKNDPRILVAGTLAGIFRSSDGGAGWKRISPLGHPEIRNIESLAIDPRDSQTVYAGTWHLPWKTTDGGETWFSIKTGILEDSDVFVITVDWSNRDTLYVGACSGIYRTDTAGQQWRKIQGIPFSARRTRSIRQDPRNAQVVYAGTTEGLWKTETGGASWRLLTSPTLIVNEVVIDPGDPEHLLLATDRAGILRSRDGGRSFTPSNEGFSHRQVWRLLHDGQQLLAAVRHDKEYGGVFGSANLRDWKQWRQGLGNQDVLALVVTIAGEWLAGTDSGLFRLNTARGLWEKTGKLLTPVKGPRGRMTIRSAPLSTHIDDLSRDGQTLYAASPIGMLRSTDGGQGWLLISPAGHVDRVAGSGRLLLAATADGIHVSSNAGESWQFRTFPESPAPVHALAIAGASIYAATERGLFRSPDSGATWERHGRGVPLGPVSDVLVDCSRVFVAAAQNHTIYLSTDGGKTYEPLPDGGFHGRQPRRLALSPDGKLYVASGYDGLFVWVP